MPDSGMLPHWAAPCAPATPLTTGCDRATTLNLPPGRGTCPGCHPTPATLLLPPGRRWCLGCPWGKPGAAAARATAGRGRRQAAAGLALTLAAPRAASGSQGGSSYGAGAHRQADFEPRCAEILGQVRAELGKDIVIFDRPVDRALLPDYYRVVTKPMDLGKIARKLEAHAYGAPQEFCTVRAPGRAAGCCVRGLCDSRAHSAPRRPCAARALARMEALSATRCTR